MPEPPPWGLTLIGTLNCLGCESFQQKNTRVYPPWRHWQLPALDLASPFPNARRFQ